MKRMRRGIAWAVLLALALALSGARAEEGGAQPGARPLYELHISLLENEQSLLVYQQVTYTNDTGRDLRYVLFQVYANALRRQSSAPFDADDEPYRNGFAPGGADFLSVQVNGEACEWGMQGESECFMRVACDLKAGEQARFQFSYYVLLPEVEGYLGAGTDWRLNAFYPALCVFDAHTDDFVLGAMSAVCDAYYAQMSDYVVTLELPEDYRVACFGQPVNLDEQNGRVSWRIEAQSVREIALSLSKYREYTDALESGVTLRVLSGSALAARRIREAADQALSLFGEWFGAYPYDVLTVTESACLTDGDSASGLIFLNASLFSWNQGDELKAELVRQLARQWFGALVGSDPVREPWLQATLSEYAELMWVESTQGHKAYLKQLNAQAVPALRVTIPGGLTVDSAADRFSARSEFQTIVLDRGIAVMHELRETMGEEAFLEALRLYAQANAGSLASIADFAAAIDEAAGRRLDEYLVGQLQTISDYAGHDVQPYD